MKFIKLILQIVLLILQSISSFAEISENHSHVEKFVQHMAQFVGEEEFALKVGQALIKRSADVGLRVDGVVTNSGLEAPKIINQPLQAVRIDRYNAFAVPLTDAIALFGAVDELTLLRKQAFEAMKTQGISDREAMEVLNEPGVKEELEKIAEVQHKIFEEKNKIEQNFDKRERELLQKTEDIAPTVNAWDLWESGSVNEFLSEENLTLEHQVALNKICTDYEHIQAERRQNHERIDYQCFSAANFAYKKAAQLAERHPKAAEAVLATIHVLTDALECYGTLQAGLLGAQLGGAAGPYGTVAGAVGGMMLTQGTAKAFAEGLEAGVQQIKDYASKLAKNEAEAVEFCQSVEGLAGAGVLAFTLKGGRHALKRHQKYDKLASKSSLGKTNSDHSNQGFIGRRGAMELKQPYFQRTRNMPAEINGRMFSGHAIDQMQNRGILPSVVENTIKCGIAKPSKNNTTVFTDCSNNISVVLNSSGKVVTVRFGE